MVIVEFGKENKEVIILLHGGGLSWWNYRDVAEILKRKYHVIIPILDGHAGSDRDFLSIEKNAEEVIKYIDEAHEGFVSCIGGLSLGGQILIEILSQRTNICEFAVIESALILPMKVTHFWVKDMINLSYGLIKKQCFSKLQFRELKIKKELYEDYYRDSCKITKENMIAFLQANVSYSAKKELEKSNAKSFIFVGEKEMAKMIRSAKRLKELLPNSELTIMKGRYHGEFSINYAIEYANKVIAIMEK